MTLMNAIKNTFLKSSIKVLHNCRRNIVWKKKSSWKGFSPFFETNTRNIEIKKKLIPKGFRVIYVTPLLNYLKFLYAVLPFLWCTMCYDSYLFYKNSEDYISKLKEKKLHLTYKDKIMMNVFLTFLVISLSILQSRTVVATFRKGNEFQTLLYGFFGPLTKNYVPHGFREMKQTTHKAIYNFKGKNVLLLSNGFRNIEDFNSLVEYQTQ